MAILTPVINVASLAGMALAGYLASVTLVDFHEEALGFTFGPVDTIFMAGWPDRAARRRLLRAQAAQRGDRA